MDGKLQIALVLKVKPLTGRFQLCPVGTANIGGRMMRGRPNVMPKGHSSLHEIGIWKEEDKGLAKYSAE